MSRRPLVLMYHGFTERPRPHDRHGLFVTTAALREQLEALLGAGWRPLDLAGYLAVQRGEADPGRSVVVTVDDGMVSFARLALPILEELGVPVSLFLPAGLVGDRTRWLSEDEGEAIVDRGQLRELVARGVDVGGHGWDHRPMAGLPAQQLALHTAAAREHLAELTGVVPRAFAYPYGRYDAGALAAVRAAGYEVAFSVHDDDGPLAVSRVDINPTDTRRTFALKRMPGYRAVWRLTGRLGLPRPLVRALLGGSPARRG